MPGEVLLYGATGYMGRLVAQAAVERGLRPILAGRNPPKLTGLAASLALPCRAFSLEDPHEVDRGLAGIAVVLHLAGPFAATSRPMLDAPV